MAACTDYLWHVSTGYAVQGGRLLDPGQRFLCSAEEGVQLEARGKAVRDPEAGGARVATWCWYEATAAFDRAGRLVHRGERFACADAEGAALAASGKAARLPWMELAPNITILPGARLARGRSVFRRNP